MNRKKLFFAGAIGNAIEVFEVLVYAFLQPYIISTFFPPGYEQNNLLFLITFILPFLAKPFGALFFGVLGDLKGRKFVLERSIMLSGISCALIGLLPSYETMGMFSFTCIIFLRCLLGFALSGEYNNSFLYLAEHSEPKSRGFIVSWASFGTSLGILMATVASFLMMHFIDNNLLPTWSFRLLFLFSAVNLYIGFKARKNLAETAEFFISYPASSPNKLKAIIIQAGTQMKSSIKNLFKVFLIFGFASHITYTLILYAPFYLQEVNPNITNLKQPVSLVIYFATLSCILIPLVGKLSDIIGRKFLFISGMVLATGLYLLFFFKLAKEATYMELVVFYFFVAISDALYSTGDFEAVESLPAHMRSTVNAIFMSIPAVLFGALSLPYFEMLLSKVPFSPLISLVIAIPLFMIMFFSKKKMFSPNYVYRYELEKAKIK